MSVAARCTAPGCSRCESPLEEGDLRCCGVRVAGARPRAVVVEKARAPDPALHRVRRGDRVRREQAGAGVRLLRRGDEGRAARRSDRGRARCACRSPSIASSPTPSLRAWLGKRGFFAPKTLRDEAVLESLTPLCWAGVDRQRDRRGLVDRRLRRRLAALGVGAALRAGQRAFGNIVIPASRGLTPRRVCAARAVLRSGAGRGRRRRSRRSAGDDRELRRAALGRTAAGRSRAIEAVAKVRVEKLDPGPSRPQCPRVVPARVADDRSRRAAGVGARVSLPRLAVSRDRPRPAAKRSCSARHRPTGARSRSSIGAIVAAIVGVIALVALPAPPPLAACFSRLRDDHQLHTQAARPTTRAVHQPHAARSSSPRPSRITASARAGDADGDEDHLVAEPVHQLARRLEVLELAAAARRRARRA